MRACDEEVGRPHHQVSKSHTIAPAKPAMTTYWVTSSSRIIPLPMVLATAVPRRNAATKLKKAAQITASLGDKTRVDTTVAMLLAASWNPFKKSKARATARVTINSSPEFTGGHPLLEWWCRNRRRSSALQGNCFEHIGDVFCLVRRSFQYFVQLLHL